MIGISITAGLTPVEKAEIIVLRQKFRPVHTQIFTLEYCRQIIASNNRLAFHQDRRNWAKAIYLHPVEIGQEIATILFEWFQADEETEWKEITAIWQALLAKESADKQHTNLGALLWHQLGILETGLGNLEKARINLEQSLQIGEELGDHVLVSSNYYELGMVARNQGNYGKAWQAFVDSEKNAFQANNLKTVIYAQGQQANILAVRGEIEQAIHLLNKSLEIWSQFDTESDRNMRHTTLHTLGRTYSLNGQHQEAKRALLESLTLKQKTYERFDMILRTKTMLADACMHLGEYREAEKYLTEDDIERCIRMGSYLYAAIALKTLSQLYFTQGNYAFAERYSLRAVEIAEQSNNPLTQLEVLLWALRISFRRLRVGRLLHFIRQLFMAVFHLKLSIGQVIKLIAQRIKTIFRLTAARVSSSNTW